jgi:hypothetical protein
MVASNNRYDMLSRMHHKAGAPHHLRHYHIEYRTPQPAPPPALGPNHRPLRWHTYEYTLHNTNVPIRYVWLG